MLSLLISLLPMFVASMLMVVPFALIFRRLGHSGWWALLTFIPLAFIVILWVLALRKWPALNRSPEGLQQTFQ